MSEEGREVRRVRALFLSDVHLGMRPTRITQLIDFLRWHEAETIYLVGDIVDGWRLAKAWYWPAEYHHLVEIFLDKALAGTLIVVLPGNHDEFLREYLYSLWRSRIGRPRRPHHGAGQDLCRHARRPVRCRRRPRQVARSCR